MKPYISSTISSQRKLSSISMRKFLISPSMAVSPSMIVGLPIDIY
jgi:hypothetical protein